MASKRPRVRVKDQQLRKWYGTLDKLIARHFFKESDRDSETVESVLKDLHERFGLRRVVFVGDRGMVTSDNIDLLRSRQQGYVVGLNRRRRSEILRY